MAKMYYNEIEAAEKLKMSPAQLTDLTRSGKLRVYADGANRMFKVADIDALAGPDASAESDILLAPAADTRAGDSIGIEEADSLATPSKSDTVITSEGISIFDDEDLEIETADPMAKTQIAPTIGDQISLEGVSSGSGLLDLTRESDDTSLGAEVLDHIDVEGEVPSAESVAESIAPFDTREPAMMEMPAVVERPDPAAPAFGALAGVGAVLMLVLSAVALARLVNRTPTFLTMLNNNVAIVLGVSVLAAIVAGVVGYFVGKGAVDRASMSK